MKWCLWMWPHCLNRTWERADRPGHEDIVCSLPVKRQRFLDTELRNALSPAVTACLLFMPGDCSAGTGGFLRFNRHGRGTAGSSFGQAPAPFSSPPLPLFPLLHEEIPADPIYTGQHFPGLLWEFPLLQRNDSRRHIHPLSPFIIPYNS